MKLCLIIGSMFASKTSELILRLNLSNIKNRNLILIRHTFDQRDIKNGSITHNGLSVPISTKVLITDKLMSLNIDDYQDIFIDEGQFFEDIEEFIKSLSLSNKDIFVSALTTNFLRKPFTNICNILAISDEIIKKVSICHKCLSDKGLFNKRLSEDKDEVVIGGLNLYSVLCRTCSYSE